MTGGLADLELARTEGPLSCGLQGRAGSAVSLTVRDSSSPCMQWAAGAREGQDPQAEVNKLGGYPWAKRRWRNEKCGEDGSLLPCLWQGGVGLPGLVACCYRDPRSELRLGSSIQLSELGTQHHSRCCGCPSPLPAAGLEGHISSVCPVSYLTAVHGYF